MRLNLRLNVDRDEHDEHEPGLLVGVVEDVDELDELLLAVSQRAHRLTGCVHPKTPIPQNPITLFKKYYV